MRPAGDLLRNYRVSAFPSAPVRLSRYRLGDGETRRDRAGDGNRASGSGRKYVRGCGSVAGLAPLIQTAFRGTHILVSRLRDEMLEAGEQEVLDEMIAAARGLQADLIDSAQD